MLNLLDLDSKDLTDYCKKLKEDSFRAKQLQRWIHQRGTFDFSNMTDLPKSLRMKLNSQAYVFAPPILKEYVSMDGTRKWIFDLGNGDAVETVFIPEVGRGTLCISSQVGCVINCRFCSTGKQGFSRNLKVWEIIGQIWKAEFALRFSQGDIRKKVITNIVIMGMGEPLLNFDNVISSIRLIIDQDGYGISRHKVTLSTVGVVPMIDRLSRELAIPLAVSLHASNDVLRTSLIPINRKYPLNELMNACKRYVKQTPLGFITFEYCMLSDINDSVSHAAELINLVRGIPCKFNLIPFNSFSKCGFLCSEKDTIKRFASVLVNAGIVTTVRKTRGYDINASCGQLVGIVQDRSNSNRSKSFVSSCLS